MTNPNEPLPCQVSDAMIEAGVKQWQADNANTLEEEIAAIYTAMNTASTIPTDGAKRAPVQGFSAGIPWDMHLRAYDAYSAEYRPQQALIEGSCRGGFSVRELDHFIPGWRDELEQRRKEVAALSIQTISGKGMREALEAARKGLCCPTCLDWCDKNPTCKLIDAALVDQGERG